MKGFVALCIFLVAGNLIQVEGNKKKPTILPKMGWKQGKLCICNGKMPPSSPQPPRLYSTRPHPSGPRPSGPYPSRPYPSRPYSTGPHPSGPYPSRPYSTGPRPSGPRPSGPRPSGPRPSGPRPSGPYPSRPYSTGPHPSRPRPSGLYPSRPYSTGPHPSGLRPSGPYPSRPYSTGPRPSGPYPSRPYSTGHHPSGPYTLRPYSTGSRPSGPYPSRPYSTGPHPSGPYTSRPYSTGSHPSGPRPSGPYTSRPYSTGPHRSGPRPSGPYTSRPYSTGPRSSGPRPSGPRPTGQGKPKNLYIPCVCRKRAERIAKFKLKMAKKWESEMAKEGSKAYNKTFDLVMPKMCKVLKIKIESVRNVIFTEGSIVVNFDVVYTTSDSSNDSLTMEDPAQAIRNAIQSGELSDLQIQPESLVVSQSYSGVNVTEWKTNPDDCSSKCHHDKYYKGKVQQTRECTEETASCDGVPLTRESACSDACQLNSLGQEGFRDKEFIIAGVLAAAVLVIAIIAVVIKCKSFRQKHVRTSPSISSLKKLTDDGSTQTSC